MKLGFCQIGCCQIGSSFASGFQVGQTSYSIRWTCTYSVVYFYLHILCVYDKQMGLHTWYSMKHCYCGCSIFVIEIFIQKYSKIFVPS